jgi:hypothetical protein
VLRCGGGFNRPVRGLFQTYYPSHLFLCVASAAASSISILRWAPSGALAGTPCLVLEVVYGLMNVIRLAGESSAAAERAVGWLSGPGQPDALRRVDTVLLRPKGTGSREPGFSKEHHLDRGLPSGCSPTRPGSR